MKNIPLPSDERIFSSWASGEDAALWKIDDKRAGVLTVDFITPVVDDPLVWGRIAAANSLSDVFAMGGFPLVALNIVGFPVKSLDMSVLEAVLAGGFEKVREAGAFLLGGHSVEDKEPKYGLVAYGEVGMDSVWRVTGARPGDVLLLTKPIGTGIVTTALKADMLEDERSLQEAIRWMSTLNDLPKRLDHERLSSVHACTDVTGFGLAGHALDMLSSKEMNLVLGIHDIPLLPGTISLAQSGLIPAGTYNNRIEYEGRVRDPRKHDEVEMDMLFDAQTSGGLLLALPEEKLQDFLNAVQSLGFESAACIGRFTKGNGELEIVDNI